MKIKPETQARLAAYTPNFKHKTTRNSFAEKLSNLEAVGFSATKPKQIYGDKLNDLIGPPNHEIGYYIRKHCLIKDANYKVSTDDEWGHPKSYLLNAIGFKRLRDEVERAGDKDILHVAFSKASEKRMEKYAAKHLEELATHMYDYSDKSSRLHNSLQHIPRKDKPEFWRRWGLPFNIDASACAPNLLQQLADRFGMNWLLQESIRNYIENKDQIRKRIAAMLGIDYEHAKKILNSLFNGGRLQRSNQCAIFRDLPGTPREKREKMEALMEDSEIRLLQTQIRHMWNVIGRKLGRKLTKGAAKWGVYFVLEREVLDVVQIYLSDNGFKCFLEHDGFRADKEVDLFDLSRVVQEKTGFGLSFEQEDQRKKRDITCVSVRSQQYMHIAFPQVV